jgi:hypothetical protein
LTYQFGYSNRDVTSVGAPMTNGKYESRHHAVMLGAGWRF